MTNGLPMRKEKTARAREAEKDKQSTPSLPHGGIGRPDVKDSLRRLSSAGRLGLRKLWLCALRRHRLVRAVFPENDEEDVAHPYFNTWSEMTDIR